MAARAGSWYNEEEAEKGRILLRTIFLLLVVVFLACPLVRAEVLQFPLPNISGGFADYQDSVFYTGDAVRVVSVSLRVVADIAAIGSMLCLGAPGVPSYYCDIGIVVDGNVWQNQALYDNYRLSPFEILQAGDYDEELGLTPLPGFAEISNGDTIHVGFYFDSQWFCCTPDNPGTINWPEATLTSVTLLVEVSPLLPVQQTTWSQIKNLYC